MIIELTTIDGKKVTVDTFSELCFTQTAGVACDSLWATFTSDKKMDEINSVKLYVNDKLVFNGFCDCQKNTYDTGGFKIYFYARSTACMLVDNEAEPYTYQHPSAKQLCFSLAEGLGFTNSLPNISSTDRYEITKGTSRYGAISQFVLLLTGEHIHITPQNNIELMTKSDTIKGLNDYDILCLTEITNRSEPLSQIQFKQNSSQEKYNLHTKSVLSDSLKINRTKFINLNSLPQWQRDNSVLLQLKSSFEDYRTLEVSVSGYADEPLLRRFNCHIGQKSYEDYILTERKFICTEKGTLTKLTLKKQMDIKEITYVD